MINNLEESKKKELYNKVVSIFSEQLDIDKSRIDNSQSLDDLGADSVDRVEIIMKIEEEFNIEISDQASDNFKSINDLVNYLEKEVK